MINYFNFNDVLENDDLIDFQYYILELKIFEVLNKINRNKYINIKNNCYIQRNSFKKYAYRESNGFIACNFVFNFFGMSLKFAIYFYNYGENLIQKITIKYSYLWNSVHDSDVLDILKVGISEIQSNPTLDIETSLEKEKVSFNSKIHMISYENNSEQLYLQYSFNNEHEVIGKSFNYQKSNSHISISLPIYDNIADEILFSKLTTYLFSMKDIFDFEDISYEINLHDPYVFKGFVETTINKHMFSAESRSNLYNYLTLLDMSVV